MISLCRRRVIIAGLGVIAAPAALGVMPTSSAPADPRRPGANEERLVLSGRVLDSDAQPLAGAAVTVGSDSAATDADGRFMLVTTIRHAERPLYRVTRGRHGAAGFASGRCDPDGTWRATFSLTLA